MLGRGVVGASAVAEGEALALLERDLLERVVVAGDRGVEDTLPHVGDGRRQLLLGQVQAQTGGRALGLRLGRRLGLDGLGLRHGDGRRSGRGGFLGLATARGEPQDENEREQDPHG